MTHSLLEAWDGHNDVHGDATGVTHPGIVGAAGARPLGAISRKEPTATTGPRLLYTHTRQPLSLPVAQRQACSSLPVSEGQ